MTLIYDTVGVVGAGAMGRGIAQIAAQAGSIVKLYDTQPQAVAKARTELFSQWDRLLEKGRMDGAAVQACKQWLQPADSLHALADCSLVIEAVVESLDVKKSLFAELATNPATRADMRDAAHALFARDGKAVSVIRDSGSFVTQRVVAIIVNIAADICQQRICSPKGDRWGPANVLEVLFNMQTVYGDPRYRPSPWLRRRGAIGLSLLHEEP